jgi:hypothetical protein
LPGGSSGTNVFCGSIDRLPGVGSTAALPPDSLLVVSPPEQAASRTAAERIVRRIGFNPWWE